MKSNRKYRLAAVILCAMISCCGCSSFSGQKNIDSGMNYLENHDYESALASFSQAQKAGESARLLYRGMGIADLKMANYAEAAKALEKCNKLMMNKPVANIPNAAVKKPFKKI